MATNKRKAKAEPAKKETKKSKTASGSGSSMPSPRQRAEALRRLRQEVEALALLRLVGELRRHRTEKPVEISAKSKPPAAKKSTFLKKAATPNKQSPGWKKVVSKKEAKATKKCMITSRLLQCLWRRMVVEVVGRVREAERRRLRGGTHAKTINPRNETAIDDEQHIQYVFRTGILDQWGAPW